MEHRLCSVWPRPTTGDADDDYDDGNDDNADDEDNDDVLLKTLYKRGDGLDKWNNNFNPLVIWSQYKKCLFWVFGTKKKKRKGIS